MNSLGTLENEEQQYGAWMRAIIERFQVHHVVKNKDDYNLETSKSHCMRKLYCQTCKESYKSNSTFKCKKLVNNKNGNFNTLTSNECKGRTRKVKKACDICGKPLGRDEKPQ